MMAPTHALIGATWWLAGTAAMTSHPHLVPAAAGTGIAALAALAPDIDSKGSDASRSLPPFTTITSWLVRKSCGGHRRITHSALGAAIFAAAMVVLVGLTAWPWWLAVAAITGWCAHVVADMATEKGCPVLWPDLTPWFLLPKPWRVRTGLRAKKIRGSNRRRHTSEWWLVRPAAFVTCTVLAGWVLWMAVHRR